MRHQTFLQLTTCMTLFLLLLACDLLEPTPTPNSIATDVAGTKTAWARATAVANTLIAELPTAIGTSTLVLPTSTFTPLPATRTPTSAPKFATVTGILVNGITNEPLTNTLTVIGYSNSIGGYSTFYDRQGAPYPSTHTDSKGTFILQFDAEWEGMISRYSYGYKMGPYVLVVDPVPGKDFRWLGMDGNVITFEVKIGLTIDLGVVKLRPR